MPNAIELGHQLQTKRSELFNIYKQHESGTLDSNGMPLYNFTTTELEELKNREKELNLLNDQFEATRLQEAAQRNQEEMKRLRELDRDTAFSPSGDGMQRRMRPGMKLSDLLMETTEFKGRASSRGRYVVDLPDVDMKTLMELGNGFAPANDRSDRVVYSARRRPVVADLIPQDVTGNQVIKWMEETTFTNNASTVSEGGVKPESALKFTEQTQTVEKIATWLPATQEQLDDVAQLRNIIDVRLTQMLLESEEIQLLNGSGTSPDLRGFLQKVGRQTQALVGGENNADTVYRAFTKVRYVSFAEPSGVIMNPDNWQPIRLLKTTDGMYIYGHPALDVEARLWGKPVIITPAIGGGTALTGDFVMFSHISRKQGIQIDVSDSHDTYFVKNLLAIRIEERLSLEIYRAAAFCEITSLT